MSASKEEINQTLRRLHSDFDFLLDNNVISSDLYDQLVEKIPRRYGGKVATTNTNPEPVQSPAPTAPSTNAVNDLSSQLHRTSISSAKTPPPRTPERSPAPPPYGLAQAEVLYNYNSADEGDLNLQAGQRITILEFVNNDWWRGENQSGQHGIFPSNYVRKLDGPSSSNEKGAPAYAPVYTQPHPQYPGGGYPGQGYQQQPQYAPQPQQQVQQPAPQPAQQEEKHSGKLAAFGKNYGKTFVNATAWGGGMTLGADVINKIF